MPLIEYKSSVSEMNRRKVAFLSLSASLFISISIYFLCLFQELLILVLPSLGALALFLIISILYFNRLLNRSKSITITISDQKIERKWCDKINAYDIKSIDSIRIKRTTANKLREIRLSTSQANSFFVNGLDNFEDFKTHLLSVVGKDVKVTEFKEPIDFDHPLFYIILGAATGTASIFLIKFLTTHSESIKFFVLSVACLEIILGLFWLISKPIAGRYGDAKKTTDIVMGAFFTIIGITILTINLIFLK